MPVALSLNRNVNYIYIVLLTFGFRSICTFLCRNVQGEKLLVGKSIWKIDKMTVNHRGFQSYAKETMV